MTLFLVAITSIFKNCWRLQVLVQLYWVFRD
jgi:hypothetical protein